VVNGLVEVPYVEEVLPAESLLDHVHVRQVLEDAGLPPHLLPHGLGRELREERHVDDAHLVVLERLQWIEGVSRQTEQVRHTFFLPQNTSLMKSMEHSLNGGMYIWPSLASTL
jgi:hypothetical protein